MAANERKMLRCAVYTRKSSEHGLEQDFNSLDAQREAAEAYIKSQAHEGWRLAPDEMTSASTWPGPTEGNRSISPTIKRAAVSGTARSIGIGRIDEKPEG